MSTAVLETRDSQSPSVAHRVTSFVLGQPLLLIVVIAALIIGFLRPTFWGAGNLENVLFQTALVGLAACGMTLLIVGGLLDLSVAGVIAVSSIAIARVLPHTTVGMAILLAIAIGAALGLINGILVTYVKIAPFIATLGTLYLFQGIAFVWTNGQVAIISSRNYRSITTESMGIVPYAFIAFILLAALTYLLLNRSYFGRTLRAAGSNQRAAELAGMPVNRTKLLTFVIAGVCFSATAIFMAGRLASAEGTMAQGFEMNVIAAVVVGGTALRGGQGTTFGTVVGALLFAILGNALNLFGIASYWQYVVTGIVLVAAIAISVRRGGIEVRGAG